MSPRWTAIWGAGFLLLQTACFDPVTMINDLVFAGPEQDDCEALAGVFNYDGDFFPDNPGDLGYDYDTVVLSSSDGRNIHAWFIHTPVPQPRGTVVISNSAIGTKACFLNWADLMATAGYHVTMYDYEGFGDSTGEKSVLNIMPDARMMVEWVLGGDDPARQSLILLGISLGSGPSISLAAEYKEAVTAVILDSTYLVPRLEDFAIGTFFASLVPGLLEAFPDELNNERNITGVHQPLLMLHGLLDFSFPIERIRDLLDRIPGEVELVEFERSGHATAVFDDHERFEMEVLEFLERLPGSGP